MTPFAVRDQVQLGTGEAKVLTYLAISALSVLVWEILSQFKADIRLIRSGDIRAFPKGIYFLSRSAALSYAIEVAILQGNAAEGCVEIPIAVKGLYVVSTSMTSLLIFFRVRKAFQDDNYVTGIFGTLWLLVAGGSTTMIFGVSTESQASSDHCATPQKTAPYVSASLIFPLFYTSLAYMFIAMRLVASAKMDFSMREGFQVFILEQCIPVYVKGLLKGGQEFYLTTIIFQLISFVIFLSTSVPGTRFVFVGPSLVILNIMTSRVYRNLNSKEDEGKIHRIHLPLRPSRSHSLPYDLRGIRVTKTVEHFEP